MKIQQLLWFQARFGSFFFILQWLKKLAYLIQTKDDWLILRDSSKQSIWHTSGKEQAPRSSCCAIVSTYLTSITNERLQKKQNKTKQTNKNKNKNKHIPPLPHTHTHHPDTHTQNKYNIILFCQTSGMGLLNSTFVRTPLKTTIHIIRFTQNFSLYQYSVYFYTNLMM